jgi:hypothetical protein
MHLLSRNERDLDPAVVSVHGLLPREQTHDPGAHELRGWNIRVIERHRLRGNLPTFAEERRRQYSAVVQRDSVRLSLLADEVAVRNPLGWD